MPDTREARLVLAVVRQRWTEVERLTAEAPPDPARFAAQCRECDVHPWVHHLLLESGLADRIGPAAIEELSRMRRKVRNDTMLLLARAEQALGVLLEAGIRPIALKGLDFLHRLYSGIDLRATDDVDLLIERRDLAAALEALRASGWETPPEPRATHYVRSSHHLPLRSPGPVPVDLELHWNLAQESRYAVDPAELFRRARPLDVGGRSVLRLDDADAVAHLLLHHFSHYFDRRLKWVVDLQRLDAVAGLAWSEVAERVRRWRGTAAAAVSLLHLRKLAPQTIPAEALQRLPVAAWRRAVTLPLRSSHPLELFRGTRDRRVQLYLAAVMLEEPRKLPAWLRHRAARDARPSNHPLDDGR